jgi:ABC-type uncharacterized transport system auxiliary subunit
MKSSLALLAATVGGTLLLSACALIPTVAPPPAQFDLGPPRTSGQPASAPLHLGSVHAPTWLNGTAISYRLSFQDPYRRESYRDSRWLAPPPALLAARLREALSDSTLLPAAAPGLDLELEEFGQVLDSPTHSHVVIRARALLTSGEAEARTDASALTVSVTHHFLIERDAASVDASGAVSALAAASDTLIDQILDWARGAGPH